MKTFTPPTSPLRQEEVKSRMPVYNNSFPKMNNPPQRIPPLNVTIFKGYFLTGVYKGNHTILHFKELNNFLNDSKLLVYSTADFVQTIFTLATRLSRQQNQCVNLSYKIASDFIIWVSNNKVLWGTLLDKKIGDSLQLQCWFRGLKAFVETSFFKQLLKNDSQVWLCKSFLNFDLNENKYQTQSLDIFLNFFKMFANNVDYKDLNGVNKIEEINASYIFWMFVEFYYFTFVCK
jgi:hypothetical protein